MSELSVQSRFGGAADDHDLNDQKWVAIGKHRRALKNNMTLFQRGEIDSAEYYRQKDYHERQIAHWESQTTDRQMDDMGEEMKNRFNSGSSSAGQFGSPNGYSTHTITVYPNRSMGIGN